jgi:chromosomal replication initiation ATPase DnaA
VLGIKPEQLQSAARYRHYVDARQMYFSLLRRATDLSLKEIGSTVNRHHSTVIHSLREHKNKVQYDIPYQQAYIELCSEISILINNKHVKEEA